MVAPKYDKPDMMQSEFEERAGKIPPHGLGLSVDVYSPDLSELVQALRGAGSPPEFLEVFKAATPALRSVRRRLPGIPLTYHGEGLWVTQPDFRDSPSGQAGLAEACDQITVLKSAWLNHECATKQMAGYSFGTYLPPLYTVPAARMTAENLCFVQARLDERAESEGLQPALLLLEMPPLTYFGCGVLPIPQFFRLITDRAACGLVLDIGHLWTVYRYTGAWRRHSVEDFARTFLREFPMERVIEIHVAGLAPHGEEPARYERPNELELPRWIDAHGAPIPDVLFGLLQVVLQDTRLVNLKGIALEVDTKPIPDILSEFSRFTRAFAQERERWAGIAPGEARGAVTSLRAGSESAPDVLTEDERASLDFAYGRYAEFALAAEAGDAAGCSLLEGCGEDLSRYREMYFPYEVLHWGGDLADMFPVTCAALREAKVDLEGFVGFWRQFPKPDTEVFDFFLIKIDRFLEFVGRVCPSAGTTARREADELRQAYEAANAPASCLEANA